MAKVSNKNRKASKAPEDSPKLKKPTTALTNNQNEDVGSSSTKLRAVICERFVNLQQLSYPIKVYSMLKDRNWDNLLSPAGKANATVVREFFKGIDRKTTKKKAYTLTSTVRGKKITFFAKAIAELLRIDPLQTTDFQFPYPEGHVPPTQDELKKALYIDGVPYDNGKWKQHFLNPDIAVLHLIVWFDLNPRGQKTKFDDDRAHLLYAISKKILVDVGKYMWTVVESVASNMLAPTAALPFGILLTELCNSKNVQSKTTDEWLTPTGPIGKITFARSQGQSKKHRANDDPASLATIAARLGEAFAVINQLKKDHAESYTRTHKELSFLKDEVSSLRVELKTNTTTVEGEQEDDTNDEEDGDEDDDEEDDEDAGRRKQRNK